MKLLSATVLGLLPLALAESILVTFPSGTPDSVVDGAKKSIVDAGGQITHEYTLLKGFSANAPEKAIQQMSTESAAYKPNIEKDLTVSIQ
ncbi:hypothetical protein BO94DRAFT_497593 [Aspergillus sclerotioniger CBS 115572]|uniref:Inhibitor I9 domain-containing protein n=1 Tax=Aspergillus sclerotioniger CBS 115572 TaxID=1450535 RepID=A0A317VVT2_9EURO|nr:hypothetical protein BO94DRAFT_497593 [Aspergillus sclerotioniger CBS 115572]PWY78413.1 hypothetical protein BO94DRAFT_497593 [Aspergillus sclerotioniger CBS 115572]